MNTSHVSLSEVLALNPAYFETWENVVERILGDPLETQRVFDLVDELETHGQFTDPVRLVEPYEDENVGSVGNGMHRILAHLITAHEPILVTYDEPEADPWVRVVVLRYPNPVSDDDVDTLISLGSFRLSNGTWAESISCNSSILDNGTQRMAVGFSVTDREIEEEFVSRLRAHTGFPEFTHTSHLENWSFEHDPIELDVPELTGTRSRADALIDALPPIQGREVVVNLRNTLACTHGFVDQLVRRVLVDEKATLLTILGDCRDFRELAAEAAHTHGVTEHLNG